MKITLSILLMLVSLSALAEENRVREEVYNRKNVYTVYTRTGKATLIQLQPGETIDPKKTDVSVLGIRFGNAWTLGVRENNFVLKPKNAYPETNMIIVTNKRTYSFDLLMTPKNKSPTYVLSFTYPEEEAEKRASLHRMAAAAEATAVAAQAAKDKITEGARAETVTVNTEYTWRGDNPMLVPTAVWDDGRFTHLQYNHAGEIPVFYKVLPDGTEALINVNVDPSEKNVTVLQEVTRTIRARLGSELVEIVNHHYNVPNFNKTGTSEHGAVRVEKSGVRNVQ
jgi:type IV secretion system protein VirB9